MIQLNAACTNVASSNTNTNLLLEDKKRLRWCVFNDSSAILYIKYGATASATSYTVQVAAGAFYVDVTGYNGNVDGIWASTNGNARVTSIA